MDQHFQEPLNLFAVNYLPMSKKKIFIIDDDQDFRISLCEILMDRGFKVRTARNADVALNQLLLMTEIEDETPDLILLDVMMPGKSGLQLRQDLLNFKSLSEIPIIFISGGEREELDDFIQKPIDWDLLFERIFFHTHFC